MKAIIDFDRASMKKTMSGMKKRHLFELCDLIKDKVIAITNLDKTQAMRDAHADVVKKFTYHSKSTNEWFTESVLCIMRRMVVETANPAYKAIAVHYRKIVRTVAIILMVVSRNQKERECRKAARASKRKRT
jgi:hypothetical protein